MAQEQSSFAVFGAGCFWCVESEFQAIDGVRAVESGYAGGTTHNPTYEEVCNKNTGHFEVVRVEYDAAKVSYAQLVDAFWMMHNPTQKDGQGVDIGPQYRSVIMPATEEERQIAEASKERVNTSGVFSAPIATIIQPLTVFYPAEDYHQDYYAKKGVYYESVLTRKKSGL
ncbi:MAG: peptide-methionine (S)-S-oxide reductase [Alphaproteobacteria bacterium]|nr:MAG: peptide-methionine (S)-S-oxide reductase [Alphaproteobacteria bacterium]TAF77421.1 MAG: peptide-methionine (S)-S-oxide reductase [Alphaproteobacteria bacterium]